MNKLPYIILNFQPTLPAPGKRAPRMGNLGHITRISNKLVQLGNTDSRIKVHLEVYVMLNTFIVILPDLIQYNLVLVISCLVRISYYTKLIYTIL